MQTYKGKYFEHNVKKKNFLGDNNFKTKEKECDFMISFVKHG